MSFERHLQLALRSIVSAERQQALGRVDGYAFRRRSAKESIEQAMQSATTDAQRLVGSSVANLLAQGGDAADDAVSQYGDAKTLKMRRAYREGARSVLAHRARQARQRCGPPSD